MSRDPHVSSKPRRRRWAYILGIPVLTILVLVVGLYFWVAKSQDSRLNAIIAQLDRDDPHWRLEEIEERRARLADEENGALSVLNANKKLPAVWPPPSASPVQAPPDRGENPAEKENDQKDAPDPQDPPANDDQEATIVLPPLPIDDRILVPPEVQLDRALTADLRLELSKVQEALDIALRLADQKHGRFPVTQGSSPLSAFSGSLDARKTANLLRFQLIYQLQNQPSDETLRTFVALLGSGRAVGDEPTLVSMLVRLAIQATSVASLERVLAQMEPSAEALVKLQRELEIEEADNLSLHGFRGERGLSHVMMEGIKSGSINPGNLGPPGTTGLVGKFFDGLDNFGNRLLVRISQSRILTLQTEMVRIAKLPVHEQKAPMAQLEKEMMSIPQTETYAKLFLPAMIKVSQAAWRGKGQIRLALLSVAAERYRLDKKRWPLTVEELVPGYLAEVLLDPYDGAPLRLKTVPDGLLVYSIGPDEQDNGGQSNRGSMIAPRTDIVFRLWDPKARRQAPAELLSEPSALELAPGTDPGPFVP